MKKPPEPGEVWTLKGKFDSRYVRHVPVLVLSVSADVTGYVGYIVTTSPAPRSSSGWRTRHGQTLESFLELYKRAPAGTPKPLVWPVEARPPEGAIFARLGDVPVGWLIRDGWEEPGEWKTRLDDDRSYEGAVVECRPPLERRIRPRKAAS
jgi:hypothetical protein